jgi:hypothetical protein
LNEPLFLAALSRQCSRARYLAKQPDRQKVTLGKVTLGKGLLGKVTLGKVSL